VHQVRANQRAVQVIKRGGAHTVASVYHDPAVSSRTGPNDAMPLRGRSFRYLSFLDLKSAIIASRCCLGTSAYFLNSMLNSPLPWVAERRSVE